MWIPENVDSWGSCSLRIVEKGVWKGTRNQVRRTSEGEYLAVNIWYLGFWRDVDESYGYRSWSDGIIWVSEYELRIGMIGSNMHEWSRSCMRVLFFCSPFQEFLSLKISSLLFLFPLLLLVEPELSTRGRSSASMQEIADPWSPCAA